MYQKFKKLITLAFAALFLLLLTQSITRAQTTADPCRDDLDTDYSVDLTDYSIMGANLFKDIPTNVLADMNADTTVDLDDYSIFSANFLPGLSNCKQPTVDFTNLIKNPGFETGNTTSWSSNTGTVVTNQKHGGTYGIKFGGDQRIEQAWITVTPGRNYTAYVWYQPRQFSGDGWGYDFLEVCGDQNNKCFGGNRELYKQYEPNVWHKLAISFVPDTSRVKLAFGVFGPRSNVEIYFDDAAMFEKTSNIPPVAIIDSGALTGSVPFTVDFAADVDDLDGGVAVQSWQFGDGSESRSAVTKHTFLSRGLYSVAYKAWDNDGALTTRYLQVNVTDTKAPTVAITSPSTNLNHSINQQTITIGGTATATNAQVTSVVWDNVSTTDAGSVSISPSANLNWTTPAIKLKPGKNEILITVTDSNKQVATDKIIINRFSSGPVVSGVQIASQSVKVYEKYEVSFNLETVAEKYFYRYDTNPPPGMPAKLGVTVEGIIKLPNGTTVKQPGFYYTDTDTVNSTGVKYVLTNKSGWAIRYSPQQQGVHEMSIRVQDASGTVTVPVGNFTATAPSRKGFIKVSSQDSRYFEYSNGELYWPTGPKWSTISDPTNVLNLDRPWLGGTGAYATNWARWISSAENHGNEGFASRLSYTEHYPGHELSQELIAPAGYKMWMGYLDDYFQAVFKPNTDYQVKIRVKTQNVTGPKNSAYSFGLVAKLHDWPNHSTFEQDVRSFSPLFPQISGNRDWHTIVSRYRTNSQDGVSRRHLSIYLENVATGEAYVDEFSMREVLADGTLGPELIRNPQADLHTYVEQRPMGKIEDELTKAEQTNTFFKYVIMDKNDWVPAHLSFVGIFAENGSGYYSPNGTKVRWLLEQWWTYLIARLGYSTSVHSWELNNEGSPDEPTHYQAAQDMAKYFHEKDAHPHLATTSFWCCWKPEFWGNSSKYPDIDYADIHEYTNGNSQAGDMTMWHVQWSNTAAASKVGMPVMRGETGITFSDDPTNYLKSTNPGIWFHNLNWAQLHSGGMSDPGYWFSEQLLKVDAAGIVAPFAKFVNTLDINKGGYVDIGSTSSNAKLRAFGQKNLNSNKAYLWVQNADNTWKKAAQGASPAAQSGNITITLKPNTSYSVQWWNTYTGQITKQETLGSNSSGVLTLQISNLTTDLAIKIN